MISNHAQLQAVLTKALAEAIHNTAKILIEELVKIIDDTVYSYGATWLNDGVTGRTGQFRESWETEMTSVLEATISQNNGLIPYSPPFSHGSPYSSQPGALGLNGLNDIINSGLSGAFCGFPDMDARPFWDNFEVYVNANVGRIFATECQKLGLPIANGFSATFS